MFSVASTDAKTTPSALTAFNADNGERRKKEEGKIW